MKGLLIKDFYVLAKQMKVFVILMFVFAIIPQTFTQGFAIMYASMVPITAIAYDERAKWGQLAAMMPYKKRDLVMAKYFIGLLGCLIVVILEIAARTIGVSLGIDNYETGAMTLNMIIIVFSAAVILLSINLPLIFKMGSERGRLVYLFLTIGVATAVVALVGEGIGRISISESQITIAAVVCAAVILVISIKISSKVYNGQAK